VSGSKSGVSDRGVFRQHYETGDLDASLLLLLLMGFGDGTIAAAAASFRGYLARLQGRPRGAIRASAAALATREPTPHTSLTTCCKPTRHTCGPAGRRVDERISPKHLPMQASVPDQERAEPTLKPGRPKPVTAPRSADLA
jgi:hypothetical protein